MNVYSRKWRSIIAAILTILIFSVVTAILYYISILVWPDASPPLRIILSILGTSILGAAGFFSGFKDLFDFILDRMEEFFTDPETNKQSHGAKEEISILVVDDDVTWRRDIVGNLLKSSFEDFTVHTARSANEARNKFSKHKYGLVVLDMKLGDLSIPSGLTLLQELRSSSESPFRVIALSAYPEKYGFEAGKSDIDAFLYKGDFEEDRFLAEVQKQLISIGDKTSE